MNDNKYLIISFSSTLFYGSWMVRQKLMSQFATTNKVLYVNHRQGLRSVLSDILRIRKWRLGIKRINKNLIVIDSPLFFPKIYRFKQLDKMIDRFYHFFIKLIAHLFGRKRIKILYIWEPGFSSFLKYYFGYRCVYHPYDMFGKFLHGFDEKNRMPTKLQESSKRDYQIDEEYLVQNAFLFYSVSELLCQYYFKKFKRRPKLMTNGVSEIYFGKDKDDKLASEADRILSSFSGKLIGYSGSIHGVLNLDIVIESAKYLNDYDFFFIGSKMETKVSKYDKKIKTLFALKNVHHLGSFKVEMLPYLLRRMNILMMIYSDSSDVWTYYNGPAKIYEYMAIGKPIISTPHPFVNKYRKIITIVKDPDQFVSAVRGIEEMYNSELQKEMIAVAMENTWKKKASIILNDIRNNM